MKHLSIEFFYISTWKVFFYQNIFIMKNLTDFLETVETSVDPRLYIITFFHLFVASLLGTSYASQIRIPNYELVFLALHFQFMCVPTVLAYLNKKKRFSLYYLSGNVSMKKYLCTTENTCRYFQYSLEVILNSILYLFQFLCGEWRLLRLLVFISWKVVHYCNIYKSWAFSSSLYDLH